MRDVGKTVPVSMARPPLRLRRSDMLHHVLVRNPGCCRAIRHSCVHLRSTCGGRVRYARADASRVVHPIPARRSITARAECKMVGGDEDRRAGAFQAYAQADSTLLAALQETPSCRAKFVELVAKPVIFWITLLLNPLVSFGLSACCHGGLFRSRSDSHTSVPSLLKGTSWLLAG